MIIEATNTKVSMMNLGFGNQSFNCFNQPGLIKIRKYTFCATPVYVPYCTFRRSFKEKCPLSGTKTQVKYVNPGTFYYVDIGTYCCVFICCYRNILRRFRIQISGVCP